jgi:hypothetical protein
VGQYARNYIVSQYGLTVNRLFLFRFSKTSKDMPSYTHVLRVGIWRFQLYARSITWESMEVGVAVYQRSVASNIHRGT